jgi:hypothetical protein
MTAKKPPAKKAKKAKKATPQYVAANDTFFPGHRVAVTKGDVYDVTDPLVKRYPGKFDPVRSKVEEATAVPGQTRKVSIPK